MLTNSESFSPLLVSSAASAFSAPATCAPDNNLLFNPESDSEAALFNALFAMPAPVNTINQDFRLFDQDESAFDYPLFAKSLKLQQQATAVIAAATASAATASADLNYFNNQLCTPETPALDLIDSSFALHDWSSDATAVKPEFGFDSIAQLLDTPYLDTPLETPYLTDFGMDSTVDSAATAEAAFPLFGDYGAFDFNAFDYSTVAPNAISMISPATTVLDSLSPVSKVSQDDFEDSGSEEDEDDFVASRSAALVSGLKRKATVEGVESAKKVRPLTAGPRKATATKRFSCNYEGCDRRFARLFNLHTHEKTHDPEQARPFICPESDCAKAFSRKHDLQRHEASVHKGERNFACTACQKPFSRQDGLRRHLAVKGSCSETGWLAT